MPKKYLDVEVDADVLPSQKQQGGGEAKRRGRPKGARTFLQNRPNPWIEEIKKVRADNPGMSYKEAMKAASAKRKSGGDVKASLENVAKKALPHVGNLAKEVGARAVSKVTGRKRTEKPIAGIIKTGVTDVGKQLAREGVSLASEKMKKEVPASAKIVDWIAKAIHGQIGQGVTDGEAGKYLGACCKACADKQSGGFVGSVVAALAPVVVPAAVSLIEKLAGKGLIPAEEPYHQTPTDRLHEAEPKSIKGKGTPGDYSFNELGDSNDPFYPGPDTREKYSLTNNIQQSIMGRGGNIFDAQKSEAPLDNTYATHANLWWFVPTPGFMGRTELPANQFFLGNTDVNMHVWEQANDVDQYINSPPTYEDGVTQIAPSALAVNPREFSNMPADSTLRSTLRDVMKEAQGRPTMEQAVGTGMVYAPGISLSKQAGYSNKYGGLFSMPGAAGRGGDITRIGYPGQRGRGVIPPESSITGTPVGVSQRGRGSMIKGSNIASWSN